jgi:gluconate 5-dehydrogenase
MSILESFSLKGQLALVTGSSSGIGLGLAAALMQAGADVVVNGRNAQRLADAAKVLSTNSPSKIYASAFDVTNPNDVLSAVADIEKTIGPLDILINNAGMQIRNPLHEFVVSDWQTLMRTNLDSMFFVGQAVARHMITRGKGKIINICSVQSELGRPGIAPYMASKGAAKMLTKGMAIDWGPLGLQVNGLGPGYFKTELTEKLVADATFTAWLTGRTPSRRWGEVAELGPAAVFLASSASSFVNGHILYVDGGVTATL